MAGEAVTMSSRAKRGICTYQNRCRSLVATLLGMTGGGAALLGSCVALLSAQVAPNKRYYTIHTTHFYIHFTSATEPTARRVAVDAERAYAELA